MSTEPFRMTSMSATTIPPLVEYAAELSLKLGKDICPVLQTEATLANILDAVLLDERLDDGGHERHRR